MAPHGVTLLALCICVVLAIVRMPAARASSIQQQSLVTRTGDGTKLISSSSIKDSTNSSKSGDDLGGTTISLPSGNSTLNSTLAIADNRSGSGGRRLLEATESTNHGYLTYNCDARSLGSVDAAAFDELLAQVQAILRIVINQAKKGTASRYGFQALFKSNRNRQKVAALFAKIMNAAVADNDPKQAPITPLVICVKPETKGSGIDGMQRLQNSCEKNPGRLAWQPRASNIVLLCESFWQLPDVLPAGRCPRNAQGVITPNESWLQLNRQSIFVHEMAHMYLGHNDTLQNETYKLADAVALSEEDSLKNPSNYAFFYAGK